MKYLKMLLMIIGFFIVFAFQIGAETSVDEAYKIGVNDVIEIKVIDHNELRTVIPVSSDGTITFPYIGSVLVKGKGISEIAKDIKERLEAGYIKYPVVTVSLIKAMSRKFYTFGPFNKRGEVPFEDNMTILRAISVSGGVSQEGLFGKLSLKRKLDGNSNKYMNLVETVLNNGLIANQKIGDIRLMPDDILIVERNKTFLIEGEVNQRGRFILEKDITVLRALLQAGGVTKDGLHGRIKIRRKQAGKTGGYNDLVESRINDGVIENSEVEDTVLMPDDILLVEKNDTFLIEGEVGQRGRVVLEKDMTVLRALLQAGGVTKDGLHGRIKIRRKQTGKTGGYNYLVESRLNDGVIEKSEVEDVVLQANDILIVERNKTFYIYGEVLRTGEFVLTNDLTVFQALTIAGGFTKWGSGSRVKILRTAGNNEFEKIKVDINDVVDGDLSADVYLKPADIIVVSSGML